MKENKLLPPSCEHPSPPTVIALSSDSHWLLSASIAPPTILLNNLLLQTPVVTIRPQCSSAAVVAADFHPQRANIFLLAFADGVCALYDVAHIIPANGRSDYQKGPAYSRISSEISYVKSLHTIVSSAPLSNIDMSYPGPGIEHSNQGIGERGIGIAAVALVPGSKAKAVTVGADGKCCVVNFFAEGKKVGSVMRSWHVQGSATSLALVSCPSKSKAEHTRESYTNGSKRPRRRVLVAIGRQDGIVLLYDLGGHLLRDREFSLNGSRIIELEWTRNDVRLETGQPGSDLAISPVTAFRQARKSVGEVPGSAVPTAVVVPAIDGASDELGVSLLDSLARIEPVQEPAREGYLPQPAVNHLDCFNLATQKMNDTSKNEDVLSGSKQTKTGKPKNLKSSRGKVSPVLHPGVDVPSSKTLPEQVPFSPPVPPRPLRQKAGGPSSPNAEKRDIVTSDTGMNSRSDQQRVSNSSSAAGKLPRSNRAKRLDVIAMNHAAAKRERETSTVTLDKNQAVIPTALVANNKEEWTDITASSRRPIRKLNGKPARLEKCKDRKGSSAFQTPSPMVSEASNDIVVDWAPASTQLVVPLGSLSPYRLPEIPPRTAKCRKKPPRESSLSNDTVVQWSSFKKGHIFAMQNKPVIQNSQPLPSSTSISPNNELNATTPIKPNPLAETSYNQKQMPPLAVAVAELPPSSTPPSRPPPLPPTSIKPAEPGDAHSSDQLRFQTKIDILRDEIALRFHVQNAWIEAQLKDLSEESRKIEEENRRLKGEVDDVRAQGQTEKRA